MRPYERVYERGKHLILLRDHGGQQWLVVEPPQISYNELLNRPQIEGVLLEGDKTFLSLQLLPITDSEIDQIMLEVDGQ